MVAYSQYRMHKQVVNRYNREMGRKWKSLTSIVLALLIFLCFHKEAVIYLSFKLNQSYIAKNLCVKKNEVQNTCCGKCYLKKQLTKDQDQEKNKTVPISENKTEPLFDAFHKIQCNHEDYFKVRKNILLTNDPIHSRRFPADIFHPPEI
jgi:hypothetical protein